MDLLVFFDIDNTLIQSSSGHVEALLQSIGVATGVFTAQQLSSAGAQKVIPDLKGADDILQILLKTNL